MATKKKPSVYSLALQQVQQGNQDEQEQPDSKTAKHSNSETEEQLNNKPVEQPDGQTEKQPPVQTARQSDSQTTKQQRIKATFYLQPEDIVAIDTMQTRQFQKTGKKPEKSELVSEAIQLLFKQLNV